MPETHKNFRHSCVVHSRHLLVLKGTAKLKSLTLTNNLTLKLRGIHCLRKNTSTFKLPLSQRINIVHYPQNNIDISHHRRMWSLCIFKCPYLKELHKLRNV